MDPVSQGNLPAAQHLEQTLVKGAVGGSLGKAALDESPKLTKSGFIQNYSASSLKSPDIIVEKYEFLEQIGEGGFGMVMKAKSKTTGTLH